MKIELRLFLILTTILSHNISSAQKAERELIHKMYLIGDAGEPSPDSKQLFEHLRRHLSAEDSNASVILLGDNIYPRGLPSKGHKKRKIMEQKLTAQLELIQNFNGRKFVIPGNHDWGNSGKNGVKYVKEQQKFIRDFLNNAEVFFPKNGCPGPVLIDLDEEIALIIIDFQWILHRWDKPGIEEGCGVGSTIDLLLELEELINSNNHKKLIIASHHPMYTYGPHGGRIPFEQFIFPFNSGTNKTWIPLPGIGLLYPFYRSVIGSSQDVVNPKYKAIRNVMEQYFKEHPSLVHVSGHEHSLQHIVKDSVNYIVSGSGSKTSHVTTGKYSQFAMRANGYSTLDFCKNGEVYTSFWALNADKKVEKIYSSLLFKRGYEPPLTASEYVQNNDLSDSTILASASDRYVAGKGKRFWLGRNYRDVWSAELEFPVFDIGTVKGGLKIVKKGGGMQTKSLRLEAENGKQYVLRSVEKYPENAIPEMLRETFAVDLVRDGISASHPYGAIVVPYLAEAADVYHTNPEIVFIPDDPRLGEYRKDFANTLALFEERADDEYWSEAENFGAAEDLDSTPTVLENLQEDNDNFIDQEWLLKSRLFDMIIGDWDRHEDQWRWAEYEVENGKGKYYQPVPRDRDQTFFVNEGVLPKLVSRKWALPKFEGFDNEIKWTPGFNTNAIHLDRSFLNKLSREEWIQIAQSLQTKLTDEVIENAIKQWPKKVYDLSGAEIITKLKARRDNIVKHAQEYYKFLAREVDITGSDKHELFIVNRKTGGITDITIWKTKKDGEKKKIIYDRTFYPRETKEIRLYGMDGNDQFKIFGKAEKGIKIRIIGGDDNDDVVEDNSYVSGLNKLTRVYDQKDDISIDAGKETRIKLKKDESVNNYDREGFKFDHLLPLLSAQFNNDDGLFLGGGFLFTKQKWRKDPFFYQQQLLANVAFATGSFSFKYDAIFTDIIGKWDIVPSLTIDEPFFVNNFFGLGNETVFDQELDIDFYRVRYARNIFDLMIKNDLNDYLSVYFGPTFKRVNVEEQEDTFLKESDNPLNNPSTFRDHFYGGGRIGLTIDTRDESRMTSSGIRFNTDYQQFAGLNERSSNFSQFQSDFSAYISTRFPARWTFASRVGVSKIFNDFEFFNASKLGGLTNLRGYRRTRFHGETSFYHNFDLRWKLFTFTSYLFPASVGVIGFHDIGRIWVDGENSDKWHRGAGGGIWIAPLNMAVLSFTMTFTEEEKLPFVRLGFFF